ncbi:DUF4388 domain-containing protein [Geobacter pickeringii]|uniref:PatA-like N-terminal domain-containing protein n=1 Tax=Geobacter pickeringii TaxID=345632 RepID=A0A0B5BCF4_9BACT|nr:DUF4388 domain-containing protein [Geobacter pickeringii]AJE02255.1 hypothetical protein GPICK_01680 [Geobacter pickeringii]
MSFTGELEHLSIVDVIQLLHATRKSGTLTVKSRKGESQLVFNDGYIISANHFDNSIRVGKILVEAKVIPPETLEQALRDQQEAGENRRPLVATLIEQGHVRKEDAYRGLETLIELTIVEILTWKRGSFTLDVDTFTVSDEYRYFPEKLNQEITLHTENVLMDALRIYDEKKRDGLLVDEELTDELLSPTEDGGEGILLSAEDLGLGNLDALERSIPGVFAGLDDRGPAAAHRRKIEELARALSPKEQEELLAFLDGYAARSRPAEKPALPGATLTVILFSADEFISYCLTTVCRHEGIFVFATNEEQDLDPIIQQFLAKGSVPLLVFDVPAPSDRRFSPAMLGRLRRQKRARFPHVGIIQLAPPADYPFMLQSLEDGIRAVIPRPTGEERRDAFVGDAIQFLHAFPAYLRGYGQELGGLPTARLKTGLAALRQLREPQEVAFSLLHSTAGLLARALTLIVRDGELIAERGIGIRGGDAEEASPPLRFRIPLTRPSLFTDVIEKGSAFFGETADEELKEQLFRAIGAPLHPTVLLLPLRCFGRTISLTYGDFGAGEPSPVPADLLEILAGQGGLVVENVLYRRKRTPPPA